MTDKKKYQVTVECVWESSVSCGAIKRKKFSYLLGGEVRLRNLALCLAKKLKDLPELGDNRPIIIHLKNDISPDNSFGIKYGLKKNGSIIKLSWDERANYNWSYKEVLDLNELGVLSGDVSYIIIEYTDGLGNCSDVPLSILDLFPTLMSVVGGGFRLVKYLKIRNSIKNVKRNGFNSCNDIREVIERKDTWKLWQVKRLFNVDSLFAMSILMNLGYIERGNNWVFDRNSPDALKMRAKWLEDEKHCKCSN